MKYLMIAARPNIRQTKTILILKIKLRSHKIPLKRLFLLCKNSMIIRKLNFEKRNEGYGNTDDGAV